VRASRPALTYIAFTGYQIGALQTSYRYGVRDLLAHLDVVIDGPYVARLDNGLGSRGSTNQQINHLTDRLKGTMDFENCERLVEWHQQEGQVIIVGIPNKQQSQTEDRFFR
jgi:anaerobic ribonucleoside-triphosphate reductase activating protein